MKRTIRILVPLLTSILVLTGCRCSHEWDPATCTDAKTCQICGVTEGEALGHSWSNATCDAPKTCEICQKTEGKALAHDWAAASCTAPKTCAACGVTEGDPLTHTWIDATCDTPKTCTTCSATEGTPLGHTWAAATCETPRTCTVCSAVDGDAPGHIWTAATCDNPKICRICNATDGKPLGHKWIAATTENPKTCAVCAKTEGEPIATEPHFQAGESTPLLGRWKNITTSTTNEPGVDYDFELLAYEIITFQNDGTMTIETGIENFDAYMDYLAYGIELQTYKELEAKGISKADADASMNATFGMTVKQYAQYCVSEYTPEDFIETRKKVYYTSNDRLYSGPDLDHLSPTSYTLEDGKLTLTDDESNKDTVFTRV